jgi:hypothetical protein
MVIKLTRFRNSDATASSGRELYHFQFLFQAASPETFGYTLICDFFFPLKNGSQKLNRK